MVNISSVKDLKQVPFPIPCIPEQNKIVEKIERQLSLADEVERLTPSQAAGRQDDASPSLGLPSELADDALVRVAVQELGAVVRVLESV